MKKVNVQGNGLCDFKKIIDTNTFYVDKTYFIEEWCSNTDEVTLITRPRRFGKTLTMSMMEYFFSDKYKEQRYLFDGLYISSCNDCERIMAMQGEYPVINISFASIKKDTYEETVDGILSIIRKVYSDNIFLLEGDILQKHEKDYYKRILDNKGNSTDNEESLMNLSFFLEKYTKKKTFIFLDEYDTPLQHAYVKGFWKKMTNFTISFFEKTFKINKSLNRAIMTGITRIAKENIFSGLNNLTVITTTSPRYARCFGFTEEEVFRALDDYGLSSEKKGVKEYYDGFIFGSEGKLDDYKRVEIYNPWSIVNFLLEHRYQTYWANSSSNSLISDVIRHSSMVIKKDFERLLRGEIITVIFDEETVFTDLDRKTNAIWGLMVCSGYLKVCKSTLIEGQTEYQLKITNKETRYLLENLVRDWFDLESETYSEFIHCTLNGDAEGMEECLNDLSENMFSSFDVGNKPSGKLQPERFYHGFVLGMLVDLQKKYEVLSNRESGFGRYDIMLKPLDANKKVGVIIEFKVKKKKEKSLEDTADNALKQIEEKKYEDTLKNAGVCTVYKYGVAFEGKVCRIKKDSC